MVARTRSLQHRYHGTPSLHAADFDQLRHLLRLAGLRFDVSTPSVPLATSDIGLEKRYSLTPASPLVAFGHVWRQKMG